MGANMVYLGGKSRIAKKIANVILSRTTDRDVCLEPFCGGANLTKVLAPHFKKYIASDLNQDLILMWREVKSGWEPPYISEVEHKAALDWEPSAKRAFARFGCSFGGNWSSGYAHPSKTPAGKTRDYVLERKAAILRNRESLANVRFFNVSFDYWTPAINKDTVIYCDPPYAGTTAYQVNVQGDMWKTFDAWADKGAKVFVSEYAAPPHWVCVWEQQIQQQMCRADQQRRPVIERLFTR